MITERIKCGFGMYAASSSGYTLKHKTCSQALACLLLTFRSTTDTKGTIRRDINCSQIHFTILEPILIALSIIDYV